MFGFLKRKRKSEEHSEEGLPTLEEFSGLPESEPHEDFMQHFQQIKQAVEGPKPEMPKPPSLLPPPPMPQAQPPLPPPPQIPEKKEEVKAEVKPKLKVEEKPELFIKIDRFKDVMNALDIIMSRIRDLETTLEMLKQAHREQEEKLEEWTKELEDIKDRINGILSVFKESNL